MPELLTVLGPRDPADFGIILPHEHLFVDLRPPDTPGWAQADPDDVIRLMAPELERAREAGIGALVESTPVGVGRRVDLVKAVAQACDYPVLVPTGIYREPWVPDWAMDASQEALADWMVRELTQGIGDTGVRAAWIKLSAGDEGLTPIETRILRAAAQAGRQTHAVIGSHTRLGRVARQQVDLIESTGYDPSRFIWIHAQNEPDLEIHLELGRRGVWIEYDGLGGAKSDWQYLVYVLAMLEAGLERQIMLSHDRGWYRPGEPGGGVPKPFTYIVESFLPKFRETGVDEAIIALLTHDNPIRAFSR